MKQVSATDTIYHLIKQDPMMKEVLHDLGFKDIVKPGMVPTVGRIMTLQKGCTIRNIDINDLKQQLTQYHYILIDME